MDITIGIFAHVDAGKTTLSEDILYRTEAVNQLGRVDDQDTVMDNDAIEKRRGITIHADVAPFTVGEHHYYLIDTPGHMDFLGECQRVFPVLDYAILVVSASDGIQAHTENLYQMLRTHHIPLFVFVNKSDLASSQVEKTKLEIVRAWDNVWFEDQGKDELIQRIAESDETLLNQYMDEKINQRDYHNALKELVKNGEITLGFCGSALKSQGVDTLLQWMDGLVQTKYPLAGDFQAKIFRVRHDKNNRKVYYVKVEKGMIKVKDMVHFYADGEESSEKCDELFCVQGAKRIPTKELHSGMVGCIVGLTKAINGQWLGVSEEDFEREPFVLQASVVWDSSVPLTKILNEFKQLEEEEPLLKVTYLSKTNEIQVRVAGKIQLEVLIEEMALRFHETIAFLPCQVVYQETIGKETIGYGHFEPLRHYAEVHLQMTPGERGSGITFESKCKEDDLSINWQRLIETHVYEKIHKGVLTGSDLTDVQFCLIAGRSHLKHTESS